MRVVFWWEGTGRQLLEVNMNANQSAWDEMAEIERKFPGLAGSGPGLRPTVKSHHTAATDRSAKQLGRSLRRLVAMHFASSGSSRLGSKRLGRSATRAIG